MKFTQSYLFIFFLVRHVHIFYFNTNLKFENTTVNKTIMSTHQQIKELKEEVSRLNEKMDALEGKTCLSKTPDCVNIAFIASDWSTNPNTYYRMKQGVDFADERIMSVIIFSNFTSKMSEFLTTHRFPLNPMIDVLVDLVNMVGPFLNTKYTFDTGYWENYETSYLINFTVVLQYSPYVNDDGFRRVLQTIKKYPLMLHQKYLSIYTDQQNVSFPELVNKMLKTPEECKYIDHNRRLNMIKEILLTQTNLVRNIKTRSMTLIK